MAYIDGFVATSPTANRDNYKAHVEYSAEAFKDHGATKVVECWGDDVRDAEVTSFPKAVQKQDDQTICLSSFVWPSKEARDADMKKVFAHERILPISSMATGRGACATPSATTGSSPLDSAGFPKKGWPQSSRQCSRTPELKRDQAW